MNNFLKLKKNSFFKKQNKGQAMLVSVVYFLFISLSVIFGIVSPSVREYKISNIDLNSKKSYYLAESGIEDTIWKINSNKEDPHEEGIPQSLIIEGSEALTTITTLLTKKEVSSIGNVSNYNRKVYSSLSKNIGVSFNQGVLTGHGGFVMDEGSMIDGNIYSNGSIVGANNTKITGTAISANFSGLNTFASNTDCPVPCVDRIFAKSETEEDSLQSLKAVTSGLLSRIELKIKKVEGRSGGGEGISYPDLIIRVVEGTPHGPYYPYQEIESKRLEAKDITNQYQWVGVNFSETQELSPYKIYWIIFDSLSSNKDFYYSLQSNQSFYGPYGGALGNYDQNNWSSWLTVGEDFLFKIFTTNEGFIDRTEVDENATAYRVEHSKIIGILDCKESSGNSDRNDNPLECSNSQSFIAPPQEEMPITDQNIETWKLEAFSGGVVGSQTFDDGKTHDIGPKKIEGDLTVSRKSILNITGTLHVAGNVLIKDRGTIVKLGDNYTGGDEGVMVVDGTITLNNNASFGTSSSGGYLMTLSTSTSDNAITINNNGTGAIFFAKDGGIELMQNATAIELVGRIIHLNQNAVVTYVLGLANANFTSGPGGAWNIQTWKEE